MLALVRALARREPRRLRRWAVLAALAVGTKDQAYALFLLAVPAALAAWAALDPWARRERRVVLREASVAAVVGLGVLAVVDGPLWNPSGFRERVRFLLGPASQAYAQYTDDWAGRWDVVHDELASLTRFYPGALLVLAVLGVVLLARDERADRPRLAAAAVPLLAAASFTAAFNCVARRTDLRFVLPQTVMLAVYGGVAVDALVFRVRARLPRGLARLCVGAAFAVALFGAADVDANLLLDPRYDAEAWLRANVAPGDVVETYGLNVYMPRFPAGARVLRVGPDAAEHRNPMPGVEEVVAPYDEPAARGARFVVVSEGWAWRHLIDPRDFPTHGHQLPPTQVAVGSDERARAYFRALVGGVHPEYRSAHVAGWTSRIWPRLEIHASTSREIWIYERR